MLCEQCKLIFVRQRRESKDWMEHHKAMEKWQEAIASGCYICSILWERFTTSSSQSTDFSAHQVNQLLRYDFLQQDYPLEYNLVFLIRESEVYIFQMLPVSGEVPRGELLPFRSWTGTD